MKKVIFLNASPRKNGNTAQLLQEAQKGARAAGAQTEYINLYDLQFTGCRSCLACKRRGMKRNTCYWPDDLSPLINKVLQARAVIIGTPVYMGGPSAHFHALFERLGFCVLSYDDRSSYLDRPVNVGLIYTMNAPRDYYQTVLRPAFAPMEQGYKHLLRGRVEVYASCDTLQVADYSKYNMAIFDAAHKTRVHQTQFPQDLRCAFSLGKKLAEDADVE